MEIIHQSPWNLTCSVWPVTSTYIGMPSPTLGPAVLHWGNDVASLPPHDILRPNSAVWHWHMSSVWPLLVAPNVQLYGTVCKWLTSSRAHKHLMISHNPMPALQQNADCGQYSSHVLFHYPRGIFLASPYFLLYPWCQSCQIQLTA